MDIQEEDLFVRPLAVLLLECCRCSNGESGPQAGLAIRLELPNSGVSTFEDHYGATIGHEKMVDDTAKVCSFTIAHVGQHERLLWYNGSLLKNKKMNLTEYNVPAQWMIDGAWEKGYLRTDMSCMKALEVRQVEEQEYKILEASVEAAKKVDGAIGHLVKIGD
jgi:hypothetical protein